MTSKKISGVVFIFIALMISASLIAGTLDIKKEVISSVAIRELNKPALINLDLTNPDESDTFNIYSLAGISLQPNETFTINSGETKRILLKAYPTIPFKISPEYYSFEYKINGEKAGMQKDELVIAVVNLKDAFDFSAEQITMDSEKARVHFKNKYGEPLDVSLELSSVLFTYSSTFTLNALEEKIIELPLSKEKLKELIAGPYIIDANIKVETVEAKSSAILQLSERADIETKQMYDGLIFQIHEVEKKNNGNLKTTVSIPITKNAFSSLFTRFNINPDRKERSGLKISYIFTKNLAPNESLIVRATTNWLILFGIIIAIFAVYYAIDRYITNKLILKKKVSFVRTKGGEFALKVSIVARARDFVEKIRIIDRLPPMVKVFERYGMNAPDRVDELNRRLEWNISALSSGEERIFSYIIYSKIGVVGRFELPPAEVLYEHLGKIREAFSNRAIFVNEPKSEKVDSGF